MRAVNTLLLAVAALSWTGSVAVAAPSSGDRVFNNINAAPFATLKKRGEVDDILQTILNKKKGGSEFCSTFLNLPPYAKTTTSTITKTVLATVPSSTFVQTAPTITATGLPVTKYSTQLDVIDVTPTVFQTVASAVPYTSTVTTVTEVVSETTAVTQTITSYLPVNDRRKEGSGIPDWLETYRSASISKACSKIVTPKTQTSYQTVISTSTIKNGVSTVTNTNTATVVVIPTQTSVVTSTSTRTNPELTSTIVSASSSLVPVTATEIVTSLTTVTSTVVVTLPSPTMKGRIRVDIIENSPFSGYFGPISDDRGFTTLVNINDAALYTIPRLSPGSSGPFNLGNPSGSNFPYLGPIFETDDSSGANIGPGLVNNYLHLGNVAKVTANTQSTDESHSWLKGNPQTYESQVWSLNSDTGALSMTWTNADGSSVLNPALLAFQFGGYINFEWTGDEPDEFRRRLAGLGLKGYLVQGLFFESVA